MNGSLQKARVAGLRTTAFFRWALVVVGFAAFFIGLFWCVLGSGEYLGDAVDHLIEALPMYLGAHPLWEPNILLGYPLFADPNWSYWYPLALMRLLPDSFNWFVLSAYLLAACGTYGLARSLTRSTTAALAAGLVYALGGFMIGQIGHVSIIEPAAWLPFVMWSLEELRRGEQRRRWIALGSVSLAFTFLAGQPQVAVYTWTLALAFVIVNARSAPAGSRTFVIAAATVLGAGTGLAAITLVPSLELARESTRAAMSFDMFAGFADPSMEVPLRLFFPYALGGAVAGPYTQSAFGTAQFAELSNYVGLPAIVLAMLALRTSWRSAQVRFWAAVAAVALAISTGNDLGIAWLLYHVPVFQLFRAPGRHAMEFTFALAVLAAYGIAAVENGAVGRRRMIRCSAFLAAGMAATLAFMIALRKLLPAPVIAGVLGTAQPSLDPLRNAALSVPMVTLAMTVIALLLWSARANTSAGRCVLLAAIALDLGGFAWFGYWHWGAFPANSVETPSYVLGLRDALAPLHQRVLALSPDDARTGVAPDLNLLWDLPEAGGYTPLVPRRASSLIGLPGGNMLDIAAVRYVVVAQNEVARTPLAADRRHYRYLRTMQGDALYENLRVLPHAWVVHRVVPTTESAALAAVSRGSFDPRADALVEGAVPFDDAQSQSPDRVSIAGTAATERIVTDCARRCFVVVSDAVYPGWSATVDGAATRLYATDGSLRGLFIPAGRHVVRFRYRPGSLELGAALSLGSLLLLALSLATRKRPT